MERISGFPEWLPSTRRAEQDLIAQMQRRLELSGFASIETPAVERLELLESHGAGAQHILRLCGPADRRSTGPSLGLTFDLTLPLARYVLQHGADLVFPFKRYQIQRVWRGERAQRGRFRESLQCDVDVVGKGRLNNFYDAEVLALAHEVFQHLELGDFTIRISNRQIIADLFDGLALEDIEVGLLRILDRSRGMDVDSAMQAMVNHGVDLGQARMITDFLALDNVGAARSFLRSLGAQVRGIDELDAMIRQCAAIGVPLNRLRVDYSLTRGYSRYTGVLFDVHLVGYEDWGPICLGGRYGDIAAQFNAKMPYPGVGFSFGITRLMSLLKDNGRLPALGATPATVLIVGHGIEHALNEVFAVAQQLRAAGVPTSVFLEAADVGAQIRHAKISGIPYIILWGASDKEPERLVLRAVANQFQAELSPDEIASHVGDPPVTRSGPLRAEFS